MPSLHSQLAARTALAADPRGERPLQIQPGAERQGRLSLDSHSSAVKTGTLASISGGAARTDGADMD